MEKKKIKKIPLEERISRMQSGDPQNARDGAAWREHCIQRGLQSMGLQEYWAGMMKILGGASPTEEIKKMETLLYYQKNYTVCEFFECLLYLGDEEEWCRQVYNCLILPFAWMTEKSREGRAEASELQNLPSDGLPFD